MCLDHDIHAGMKLTRIWSSHCAPGSVAVDDDWWSMTDLTKRDTKSEQPNAWRPASLPIDHKKKGEEKQEITTMICDNGT